MKAPRALGNPRVRRTAAYVALVVYASVGIWRVELANRDLHDLVRSEAAEDRVEDAQRCVTSWEVRGEIRASDRTHSIESAEALIEVVNPDDPELVELYRAVLDRRLRAAGRQVGDPDCDLAASRAVIDNQENP